MHGYRCYSQQYHKPANTGISAIKPNVSVKNTIYAVHTAQSPSNPVSARPRAARLALAAAGNTQDKCRTPTPSPTKTLPSAAIPTPRRLARQHDRRCLQAVEAFFKPNPPAQHHSQRKQKIAHRHIHALPVDGRPDKQPQLARKNRGGQENQQPAFLPIPADAV